MFAKVQSLDFYEFESDSDQQERLVYPGRAPKL